MAGNFFENLGKTISETGQKVYDKTSVFAGKAVDKTKITAQKTKLKSSINSEKREIDKAYLEIGKYYFKKFRENPDEEIAASFERVEQGFTTIAGYSSELKALEEQEPSENPEDYNQGDYEESLDSDSTQE
jgi:hypothetical protein